MSLSDSPLGLRIIGILKLASAGLLLALGLGIFHSLGGDVAQTLEHFVRRLHLDPDSALFTRILAQLLGISHAQLEAIDAATFLYALLYLVEGIGLLLARRWAEYFTIFMTSTLIPLEIYEIVVRTTMPRVALLCANIIILIVLIYQLRSSKRRASA